MPRRTFGARRNKRNIFGGHSPIVRPFLYFNQNFQEYFQRREYKTYRLVLVESTTLHSGPPVVVFKVVAELFT